MNDYDFNSLTVILVSNDVAEFHCTYTNHDGHLGVILLFQKSE